MKPRSQKLRSNPGIRGVRATAVAITMLLLVTSCAGAGSASPSSPERTGDTAGGYALSATDDTAAGTPVVDEPTNTATPGTATAGAPDPGDAAADGQRSPDGDIPPAEFPTGIVPTRIQIPAIDVDAPVIDLDLRGDEPEVPEDFADTGWYEQTRLPGEIGPSVIAGHVDSVDGPAVFARLSLLEAGDEIVVTSADGAQRTFVVADTGQYPKTNLPDEVFGFGEPVPELRLITCGGTFDRSVRHYVDNFVVYAVSSSQSPSAL